MLPKKIFFFLFISFIFSSCVLIQESKNKKNLKDVEYVRVYDEDENTFKTFENEVEEDIEEVAEKKVEIIKNPSSTIEDSEKIWYHPNPWWRIESPGFPSNKDSIKHIKFAAQYGFSNYVDPTTLENEDDTWDNWTIQNKHLYKKTGITHSWQSLISINKDIFEKHPEYLAEIDGKRLGYGKSNKLCVTNKSVQNLFVEYTIKRIKDDPNIPYYSIEPADGGSFCTCINCSKLGSISNQVFYFANQVAIQIKKTNPTKQLGVLAYYTHSDPPDFKIEDNIKVAVAPKGFQTNFSPIGIMESWTQIHKNLGSREYFGIPQWTAEQPRIIIQDYVNRIKYAQSNQFDVIIFEASTNINSTILMTMLSQIMMNSSLSWNEVYNSFLNQCFKESKLPIKRLLDRWHSTDKFDAININYSLYDLHQAEKLAKDVNEIQRIRDLKAYVHYLVLLETWSRDRENSSNLKKYFDYIYNSSNRNIVNTNALSRLYAKSYNSDPILKSRYTYRTTQDKDWIKFITDQEIENNFQNDLKAFPPIFNEKITNQSLSKVGKNTSTLSFLENYDYDIRHRVNLDIYVKNTNIILTPRYTQKNTKTMLSIYSKDGTFIQQKLLNNNEVWSVKLPESGLYTITQNRVNFVKLNLKGSFLPILNSIPKTIADQQSIQTIDDKLNLEKYDKSKPVDETNPIYIITKPIN